MTRADCPNFIPAIEKSLVTLISKETTTLFWVLITSPAVPLPPSVTLTCAISGRSIEASPVIVKVLAAELYAITSLPLASA